jgi:GDSL-like Lipase/Acylhydrolase
LYNYGARKVVLIGVGQVGCSPNELSQRSQDGATCVGNINSAIQIFNNKLISLVDQFNSLPGAHFTYINAYHIFEDILRDPQSMGRFLSFNVPHQLHLLVCGFSFRAKLNFHISDAIFLCFQTWYNTSLDSFIVVIYLFGLKFVSNKSSLVTAEN